MKLVHKAIVLASFASLAALVLAADWPKIVTSKTLYADNDLRGKKAPNFFVEQWLNTKSVDTRGKVAIIDF